ncbi:coagulation factor X-like [Mantella aurantiaca]
MGLRQRKILLVCFIFIFTPHVTFAVFLNNEEATSVLKSRVRRANSFFEELRSPSLERECIEEVCSREEAREIFKDERRLKEFWRTYSDVNDCLSNPCLNGGLCSDEIQSYVCTCPEGYEGRNCETNVEDSLRCEEDNGQCEQFCHNSKDGHRKCVCMEGYALGEDGISCIPTVEYPCGQIPVLKKKIIRGRIVGGEECPKGECPWQARLVLKDNRPETMCGGSLIAPNWVVTAAHCVLPTYVNKLTVVLGDHRISKFEGTEQERKVVEIIIHEDYRNIKGNYNHDIALLRLNTSVNYTDYVVPMCLPEKEHAVRVLLQLMSSSTVSGWGRLLEGGATPDILRRVELPRVKSQQCKEQTRLNITENMFCAGYTDGSKDACKGDSGGPYITKYKNTYYLTGIVSWGIGCADVNKYGVYTRVSRYTEWINKHMNNHSMAGKIYLIILTFLPVVLLEQPQNVFVNHDKAHSILGRFKRANSGFEEFKKGNLERECREELCSYEEAREIFEDDVKTQEFWNVYHDGNQCDSDPCLYGGSCKDGIGSFTCLCNPGFEGKTCESVILKVCSSGNGGCEQYCKVENRDVTCSCTTGYSLADDGKACVPNEGYPCGKRPAFLRSKRSVSGEVEEDASHKANNSLADTASPESSQPKTMVSTASPNQNVDPYGRIVGGRDCQLGECPWQALLISEDNEPFCGGTILSNQFILTAAHCMNQTKYFKVVVGEVNTQKKDGTESTHKVEKIIVHPKFARSTYDFDMAVVKLKEAINYTDYIIPACLPDPDFADEVLMKEREAMVSGFGRLFERSVQATKLQMLNVPYVDRLICKQSSKFKITDNMFCAGYDTEVKDACQGDSGGPHVTSYKDTYFVTGIVSWGEGCAQKGKYGVYTKVSRLYKWLKGVLKRHQ